MQLALHRFRHSVADSAGVGSVDVNSSSIKTLSPLSQRFFWIRSRFSRESLCVLELASSAGSSFLIFGRFSGYGRSKKRTMFAVLKFSNEYSACSILLCGGARYMRFWKEPSFRMPVARRSRKHRNLPVHCAMTSLRLTRRKRSLG